MCFHFFSFGAYNDHWQLLGLLLCAGENKPLKQMLGFECFPHRCGYGRYRFNLPSQEKKITIEYVELCFLTVSENDWVVLELLLHALGSGRGKDFVLETAPGCLLPPAGRRHRAPAGGWDEGPGPRSAVARCLRSPGARPGRGSRATSAGTTAPRLRARPPVRHRGAPGGWGGAGGMAAAGPGGAERYFTRWYKPGTARRAGAGAGVAAAAAAGRSLVFVPCCRREGAAVRGLLRAAALQQASVGLRGFGGLRGRPPLSPEIRYPRSAQGRRGLTLGKPPVCFLKEPPLRSGRTRWYLCC